MASRDSRHEARTHPIVLHIVAPGPVGGLEQVVVALTAGLRQVGQDARVAAVLDRGAGDTPFLARLRDSGVPVTPIELAPRAYAAERRRLGDLLRAMGPDVVHTHGYRADIQAAAVARTLHLPTVTTVHGFTGGGWKNRLYERLQLRSFRTFAAVVAVSGPLSQRLQAAGVPADRIHLVPNAAPPSLPPLHRAAARLELGIPSEAFVAGWVGRLSAEKGLDLFLEALALTGPEIHGAILGTGDAYDPLTRLADRRGLGGRIVWAGVVPDAGRLFPAFDCFVLSSRTEGTPIVLFEAMAADVPIVATAVGGVPDVVSEREAVLTQPGSADALAAGIVAIATNPAGATARATAARQRLEAERRPEPWVARYEALYRQILAPSRSRPSA
jgi:glycosyltransferase involved in cell wall biosynthesis